MPTKLEKPITIVITHVENAVIAALKFNHRWDGTNAKHITLAYAAKRCEAANQLEVALTAQGIDYRTWEPPKPLMAGSYEVQINPDGSVKAGCTTVTSEQFEQIVKKRAEVMEKRDRWFRDASGDLHKFEGGSERGARWCSRNRNWLPSGGWHLSEMLQDEISELTPTQAAELLK